MGSKNLKPKPETWQQAMNSIVQGLSKRVEELTATVRKIAASPFPDMALDPWAHRSAGMRCGMCMYFAEKKPRKDFGRCRRHAPTMSGFPAVFATDWCGDHKVDETRMEVAQ